MNKVVALLSLFTLAGCAHFQQNTPCEDSTDVTHARTEIDYESESRQRIEKIRSSRQGYRCVNKASKWKRECREWCKKTDLWSMLGAGEFVDSAGYRHALGVAFEYVKDSDTADLSAEASELAASANLLSVLGEGVTASVESANANGGLKKIELRKCDSSGVFCIYQKDSEDPISHKRCFISVCGRD